MRQRVDEEEARRLGALLRRIGLEKILELEEEDPQLHAVRRVSSNHGPGWASVTAALVALVSYRLAMKGEEWWACYGDYFSIGKRGSLPEACDAVASFLRECRGAVVQREAKEKRVRRACTGARGALEKLYNKPEDILPSASWLTGSLSRALRQEPWRKTIVFSAKMAYYAVRSILNPPPPAPRDVPLPVDVRISCITYSSGLVSAREWRDILRDPRTALEAWRTVSEESGIPQLNIDSLLWMIGSTPRDTASVEKARELIVTRVMPVFGEIAWELASLLVKRPCEPSSSS